MSREVDGLRAEMYSWLPKRAAKDAKEGHKHTDTTVVAVAKAASIHADNQNIANNTDVAVVFDTEVIDTDGMVDISANPTRITFATAGKYGAVGSIPWGAGAASTDRFIWVRLNGTTQIGPGVLLPSSASRATQLQVIVPAREYVIGDYIELIGRQHTGSTLSMTTGGDGPQLAVYRIGPSGVANLGTQGSITDHGALTGLGDDDHTQYQKESEKDAASGYAGLTAGTKLNLAQMQEVMAHADLTDSPADAHHAENHNIFSTAHADTTGAAAPVDGDIIIGNVTPKWSKLARSVPAINQRNVLGIDNAELRPSWKTLLSDANPADISDAAFSGEQTPAARGDHEHRGVLSVAGPSAVPIYGAALFDASGGLIGVSQAGQTITLGLTSADVVVPDNADWVVLIGGGATTLHTHTFTQTINVLFDGGGSVLTTGMMAEVELPADVTLTLTEWRCLLQAAENITITVTRATYAAYDTFSALSPALALSTSAAIKNQATGLTTSLTAGWILRFEITAAPASATWARAILKITRTP